MGRYSAATTAANEITTRLRMDSDEIADTIRAASTTLSGSDFRDTVDQLQRLWSVHEDRTALNHLKRLDRLVYGLNRMTGNITEVEFVDPQTLRPDEKEQWIAEITMRSAESQRTQVPDGFFNAPHNVD